MSETEQQPQGQAQARAKRSRADTAPTWFRPAALKLPLAAAYCAHEPRTWQAEVQAGRAPKPRQIGRRSTAWLVTDLDEWLATRPVSEIEPGPGRRAA